MSNNIHPQATEFDVLVIYSDKITISASNKKTFIRPFKKSHSKYNDVYAYLLEKCEEKNIKAAFSTTSDIVGSGLCKSYWEYKSQKWEKVDKPCKAPLIFDKFFPKNKTLELLREQMFSSPHVKPFTNSHLLWMFFDKFQTYSEFANFSVPTVKIENMKIGSIKKAVKKLQEKSDKHFTKVDFLTQIIMKDRFGSGGNNIYKIDSDFTKQIFDVMKENEKISFIIQPFIQFDKGFQYKNYSGSTEIRLIYLGKKVVQTYIRVAGNADFLCNHGDGGIWITQNDIPQKVKNISTKIAKMLDKKHALFALDFVISNNGNVYLLEANISPGIDWYDDFPENKKMNMAMIDIIVEELSRRVLDKKLSQENNNSIEKILTPKSFTTPSN